MSQNTNFSTSSMMFPIPREPKWSIQHSLWLASSKADKEGSTCITFQKSTHWLLFKYSVSLKSLILTLSDPLLSLQSGQRKMKPVTNQNGMFYNPNVHWQMNRYMCYVWYIYTHTYTQSGTLLSHNRIMPLATTWMDLDISLLSKTNQKDKEKYHKILLLCGI